MADAHANFAYSLVATAPSPASSGTSLVVTAADGAKFPAVPFNAVVWATAANPLTTNAEVVRVTAISTDTFTITRAQEGSSARTVVVGDQIAAAITAKSLTDIEAGAFDQTVVKTADETVTASTTVQNDDHLIFAIGASATEIWFFEGMLLINGANATMDFKFTFTGPASSTGAFGGGSGTGATGFSGFAQLGGGVSIGNLAAFATTINAPTGTANIGLQVQGWVFGGGTAGNVTLQWAQAASDAGNLVMKKGSFLRAKKLIA